jgi:hypothetical protein
VDVTAVSFARDFRFGNSRKRGIMRAATIGLISICVVPLFALPAFAWGAKGHRIIGVLAAKNFPAEIPEFLRTQEAAARLGELAREPDRSRGSGNPHDQDRDPAHFVGVSDDGTILGGPLLAQLPANREDYDNALRAHGNDQYKAGWLPYSIMDGWQQLVKDFALWRADAAGEKFAHDPADKEWFTFDRRLRELITLRDLGEWSHFVGDGSQPLHATVHFNGWGDFPNPQSFTLATNFHARFETDFINANISKEDVAPLMAAPNQCHCSIQQHTADYLARTKTYVEETYRLDMGHGFDNATPEAKRFAAARLAEGAAMLRDMVVDAWAASDDAMLGYKPQISVKDIEAGKADPKPILAN